MQKISIDNKNWGVVGLLLVQLLCVGYLSIGINFTDSDSLLAWAKDREHAQRYYTTFLDYYWLIGIENSANIFIFNSLLLSLIIYIIFSIQKPSALLIFFLMPYACLLSVVSKELFFVLGVAVLLLSHKFIGLKRYGLLAIAIYLLMITKLALAAIYLFCYAYACLYSSKNKLFYFILLILICYLGINSEIYRSYYFDYFVGGSSNAISQSLSGNKPLDWILRAVANLLSPIMSYFGNISLTNYSLYIAIFSTILLIKIFIILNKNKSLKKIIDRFDIRFFLLVNIVVAILIPFVQTRYIIPVAVTLFLTTYKK